MKLFCLFFSLLGFSVLQAQNCAEGFNHEANADGIPVHIYSENNDECFQVLIKSQPLNPDPAKNVYFYAAKQAQTKIVVKLSNGELLEKNFFDAGNMGNVAYYIDKNKKGKYSLKLSLKNSGASQAAKDEWAAKQKEEEAARKAKKEADDKRWDAESAERSARMKESVKLDSEIEREKREAEEAKKAEEAKEAKKAEEAKKIADAKKAEEEAQKAKQAQNPSNSSNNNSNANTNKSNSNSHSPNQSGIRLRFRFLKAGIPIANTDITLKAGNVFIGSGTTDGAGNVDMYTKLPAGRMDMDIYGKKGGEDWSVKGLYSLTVNSDMAEPLIVDIAEGLKQMQEMMKGF